MGSFHHRSAGPAMSLLQQGLPTGSQPPLDIHLLQCGVLHGLQMDICSTVDLCGLQRNSLPHHGLLHGLQGKDVCSSIWSTSSPSCFTDLGAYRVVSLTSSHSSFLTDVSPQVFPLLKYVIPEVLPLSLTGLVLASSGPIIEPAGSGSVRHGGNFSQLLTEATPIPPCYQNLATKAHNRRKRLLSFISRPGP